MTQLSANFSLAEFVRSQTAEEQGIDNTPPPKAVDNLKALCENVLQPLRDRFGPIRVLSGFRSPALNAAIKGAPGSQHMKGQAADIAPVSASIEDVYGVIVAELKFDQAIRESPPGGWIHVSFNPDAEEQRGEVLLKFPNDRYREIDPSAGLPWKG